MLLAWVIVVCFTPYYFFPSGQPQVADFLFLSLVVLFFVLAGLGAEVFELTVIRYLAAFAAYTLIVSFFWYMVEGEEVFSRFPRAPLFYFFNLSVFALCIGLYSKYRQLFLVVTVYAVALAVPLQIVLSQFFSTPSEGRLARETLFFNNPNQLGYYAILSATVLGIGAQYFRLSTWLIAIGFVGSIYLALVSLSKAAILGAALVAVVTLRKRRSMLILGACLILLVFGLVGSSGDLLDRVHMRMASLGSDPDDNFSTRGYDRILNHKEYWVFGAAEGGTNRFNTAMHGEIHSSLGTIFFSYGIFGSLIFSGFAWALLRGSRPLAWGFLVPLLFYGITHNGLRFRMLWITLALFYCVHLELRVRMPVRRRTSSKIPARQGHKALTSPDSR